MLYFPSVFVESACIINMKLSRYRELFHIDDFHQHIEDNEIIFMHVLSEGFQQKAGLLLKLQVSAQNKENIESKPLIKNSL